jgi:hypothetical protein
MDATAVAANGAADSTSTTGMVIDGAMDWEIVYSTVAGNRGMSDFAGREMACTEGSPGAARNSIFMGEGAPTDIDCAYGTFDDCVVDLGSGGSTVTGDNLTDLAWTPTLFSNPAAGDLHVEDAGDSPLADLAVWRTGDPAVDIDGQPRANVDGVADWPGVDVP